MILTLYDRLNNSVAFQFRFMTLAVDVIDRCGTSNEIRRQLKCECCMGSEAFKRKLVHRVALIIITLYHY